MDFGKVEGICLAMLSIAIVVKSEVKYYYYS